MLARIALVVVPFAFVSLGCDADEVAKQCVSAGLVAQCPAGSNPVLGAQADEGCDGDFSDNVVSGETGATATCRSSGGCDFMCQFAVPCLCGVKTLSKEEIVCNECQETSCGDGRCDGNERERCEGAGAACVPCAEDCGGATCGDGDCTGSETPQLCPQDCAAGCTPNAKDCLGPITRVCQANGATYDTFDCSTSGQTCRDGVCVTP